MVFVFEWKDYRSVEFGPGKTKPTYERVNISCRVRPCFRVFTNLVSVMEGVKRDESCCEAGSSGPRDTRVTASNISRVERAARSVRHFREEPNFGERTRPRTNQPRAGNGRVDATLADCSRTVASPGKPPVTDGRCWDFGDRGKDREFVPRH